MLSSWLPAVPTPFPFEAMRSSVVVGVVVSVVVGVVVSVVVGIVVGVAVGIVVGVVVVVLRSSRLRVRRQKTNAPMAKPAKTSSAAMAMPAPAPADKPPFEAAAVPG